MAREMLLELWKNWWDGDIWIAPWSKAIDGLTPQQAGWQPAPERHCIWQNVVHVTFWRTYTLRVIANQPKPSSEDVEAGNFAMPAVLDDSTWRAARSALKTSHDQIAAAMANPQVSLDRLKYHLAHDAYHLGQIMQLRALQNLPAIV